MVKKDESRPITLDPAVAESAGRDGKTPGGSANAA